jgi:predicted secreted protein
LLFINISTDILLGHIFFAHHLFHEGIIMLKNIVLVLMIMAFPIVSGAEQPLTYDRINFSVSVNEEVENDTTTAVLYAQREGSEAGKLADEVNEAVTWAVERAKEVPAITVQTGSYQTHPVYANQTLTGWQVRQSLSLESRDTTALSQLLGRLQQRLALQSINYSISTESRQIIENQLIAEALASFSERAQMVAAQLNRPDFRIVSMDINTGGGQQMRPMARGAMLMSAEASVAPPTLEAGTDIITITVHGTIELQVR